MKTHKRHYRIRSLALATILMLDLLVGVTTVFMPKALAATAAHTVYSNQSLDCYPQMQSPSDGKALLNNLAIGDSSGTTGTDLLNLLGNWRTSFQGDTEALNTFNTLSANYGLSSGVSTNQLLSISFSGTSLNASSPTDPLCRASLLLFRIANNNTSSNFYGVWSLWDCTNQPCSNGLPTSGKVTRIPVSATVNISAKTLSLNLGKYYAAYYNSGTSPGAFGAVSATLSGSTSLLTDCQYFNTAANSCSGGGSSSGGTQPSIANCVIIDQSSFQSCIKGQSATFQDVAHISFMGNTYEAQQWQGNMQYKLVATSSNGNLQNLSPYFVVVDDQSAGGQSLGILGSPPTGNDISLFASTITRTGNQNLSLKMYVTNSSGSFNADVSASPGGINKVATFYDKTNTIQLDFANGAAGNESHFYGSYTQQSNGSKTYVLNSGGYSCSSTKPNFVINSMPTGPLPTGSTTATWTIMDGSGCYPKAISVSVVFDSTNSPPDQTASSTAGSTTTTTNTPTPPTCEINQGISLAWIMCPVVTALGGAVNAAASLANQMLQININPNATNGKKIFTAWSNFRLYGDIFLVIALLAIVFGEAIGGGLIDAYTAKKVLPRILAAAILINLSYYIVIALVDVFNVIGGGLGTLITQPFGQSGNYIVDLGFVSSTALTTILGAGVAVAWVGGTELLMWGLLFVLMPALLIFLAIIITIMLRTAFIILLLIASPVAFALYTMPNTSKYFKRWWDELFKTLLVYPLIVALFAMSKVVGVAIGLSSSNPGNQYGGLGTIVQLLALLSPLILIPFAFRMAGGIIGKAYEMMHNTARKGHQLGLGNANDPGSLRNRVRRNTAAKLAEKNVSGAGLAATLKPGNWTSKDRRVAGRAAARNMYQSVYGKSGMGSAMFEANKDDSQITGDLAKYATGAASREAAKKKYDASMKAATTDEERQAAKAEYEQRLFSSAAADKIGRDVAMRRRALMSTGTIGYEFDPGKAGWDEADGIMRELSGYKKDSNGNWVGGDEGTYRSIMNEFQYVAKSGAGRADLSGAVNGGEWDVRRTAQQHSMYEVMNSKPAEVTGISSGFKDLFTGGTDEDKQAAAIWYKELKNNAANAKGGTRDAVDKALREFQDLGVEQYLDTASRTASGRIDPSTGVNYQVQDGIIRDKNSKPILDRSGNPIPFMRDETVADRINSQVRAYERPDPNHMT